MSVEGTRESSAPTRIWAPAKLTRSLRVLGLRPDGYHELASEMVTLDFADLLEIDPSGRGLSIEADRWSRADGLAGEDGNLVTRALDAVGRHAGIRLRKRIPVGGGLGGGSADAAAVLRWAGCDDASVAAALGADVAFCVRGGRALVGGIGEQLTPLSFEARTFTLLLPPFGVNTAAVYRAFDELATETPGRPVVDAPTAAEGWQDPVNDLTDAALVVEPRLGRWRDALAEVCGVRPRLAGSGSTWFVEGAVPDPGVLARGTLTLDGEEARILVASTVPGGWAGPPQV